ncbi:glycoside hydrolase [Kalaharituber pfeilii]|nr:glycoside hydrolase [Kalaharituber pfeilii]
MWVPGTASPLHISNTPLFPRVQRSAPPQTQPSARDRAGSERAAADPPPQPSIGPLLVCHDFKGGYLAYEKYQGMEGSETVYTCEYLHFIDTFVYFSHKRVAPPPASWINLMHKNGVRILGTFIVEGDSGTRDLHKIFQGGLDGADATFYANQLVLIAKTYGFDGWLLNFESNLPNSTFDLPILLKWLGYLKQEMHMAVPGGQIIWYDALTIDNRVKYQNGITDANKPFFDVSDGIFTNYWWREHNLHETAKIASALGRPRDVFSGVDVWGRGSLGNGGFNVGEALTLIQRYELAVALFAPGWTYEFLGADKFWENDRRFWVGGCYQQDSKGTAGTAYGPIAEYVSLQACGSSSFFYTNFNRGFGKGWKVRGQVCLEPQRIRYW